MVTRFLCSLIYRNFHTKMTDCLCVKSFRSNNFSFLYKWSFEQSLYPSNETVVEKPNKNGMLILVLHVIIFVVWI